MKAPRLHSKLWRLENLYYIIDKQGKKVKFKLNQEQLKLFNLYQDKRINNQPLRENILKDRQIGITTFHCIYYLDEVVTKENCTAAIIAHDRDSLEKIFRKVKFAWENMPEKCIDNVLMRPNAKMDNKRELLFEDLNSNMYIALKVRSGTVNHLHVSEIAYIADERELKAGSFQAVPINGDITTESTGNGMNHFYRTWIDPGTTWTNHFFSWLEHSEYQLDLPLPPREHDDYLRDIGATEPQRSWWYMKHDELGKDYDLMMQEYPSTAEEAFITSNKQVFRDCVNVPDTLEVLRTEDELVIYLEPQEGAQYILGADTSAGYADGDYSNFYIMDNRTRDIVARYNGHIAPDLFALKIKKACELYNKAMAGIEVNNHGLTVITVLKEIYSELYIRQRRDKVTHEITNEYGWLTTDKSKQELIDSIRKNLRDKDVEAIPKELKSQLQTFVREGTKTGAETGCHDDEVMAFGICLMVLEANPYYEIRPKMGKYMGRDQQWRYKRWQQK